MSGGDYLVRDIDKEVADLCAKLAAVEQSLKESRNLCKSPISHDMIIESRRERNNLREQLNKLIGVIDEWFGLGEEQQYYIDEIDLNVDPGIEPWYSVFNTKKEAEEVLLLIKTKLGEGVANG